MGRLRPRTDLVWRRCLRPHAQVDRRSAREREPCWASPRRRPLTPDQLVSAILKAPVDLLWNGGIGTYVKAEAETHSEVGDRANDGVRVNGVDLRCKMVGEGGNLGFTQRGRVEYALKVG